MAGTMADLVENMDLPEGEPSGITSTEPSPEPNKDDGGSKDDPGNGDPEPSGKPGDEGEPKDGSGGDGKSTDGVTDPEADTGYIADEEDEGGSEPTPQTKEAEPLPTGLSADLQYVVDRLPVLSVRGKDRTYQVKAAGQLPEDFEFASKREELIFNQSLAAQELKADKLLAEYNSNKQAETFNKYSEQENSDIRHDIGDLQRENELPRFRYLSTDSRFADDPAVKAVQEVMDYMNEKNQDYINRSKPYRVTFRDAYDMMVAKITKDNAKGESPAQKKEDTERKQASRSTSSGRSTNSNPIPKATVSRNMEDLMAKIDNMQFD